MKPTIHSTHVIGGGFAVVYDPFAARDGGTVEKTGIEDSNPVENMNDTGSYGYYNSTIWAVAGSFTANEGGKLKSVKVYARRNGTNVDHQALTARIYETSDPVTSATPEGAVLASSQPVDSETIVLSPDIQPIEFFFGPLDQIQFEKGKVYCFAIERGDIGSADVIRFGFLMGDAGVFFSEARGNMWLARPGFDLIFYVYSE